MNRSQFVIMWFTPRRCFYLALLFWASAIAIGVTIAFIPQIYIDSKVTTIDANGIKTFEGQFPVDAPLKAQLIPGAISMAMFGFLWVIVALMQISEPRKVFAE